MPISAAGPFWNYRNWSQGGFLQKGLLHCGLQWRHWRHVRHAAVPSFCASTPGPPCPGWIRAPCRRPLFPSLPLLIPTRETLARSAVRHFPLPAAAPCCHLRPSRSKPTPPSPPPGPSPPPHQRNRAGRSGPDDRVLDFPNPAAARLSCPRRIPAAVVNPGRTKPSHASRGEPLAHLAFSSLSSLSVQRPPPCSTVGRR